jgi:general stress protein 26
MGDIKNLYDKDAIEKIKELVKSADICLFTTDLATVPLVTRPMSTQLVDDDGALWFLSERASEKNTEIEGDNRVQLFYFNKSNAEYLSIFGEAEILYDRQKIKELWTPIAKAWFTGGEDDPAISIIKVKALEAYYWDTKHNKMVAMLKILAGAITGKTMDDGVEGKMRLKTK